jgi:hypothetical protein
VVSRDPFVKGLPSPAPQTKPHNEKTDNLLYEDMGYERHSVSLHNRGVSQISGGVSFDKLQRGMHGES